MGAHLERPWDPGTYGRFRDLRLRPALDLLARVGDLPAGEIVDLGCGAGAVGPVLRARWPGRRLTGLDSAPEMLAQAEAAGCYDACRAGDIAAWAPRTPPALIFSNAVLHWLPDHARLLPCLADTLAAGGTLAVQMPDQQDAPSHRLLADSARAVWPDYRDAAPRHVLEPVAYHRLLAPLGTVAVWQTDHLQRLAPQLSGHPVAAFTQSTAMRPHLDVLPEHVHAAFRAAYDEALAAAYPPEPDGGVLFPFRRTFVVLTKDP